MSEKKIRKVLPNRTWLLRTRRNMCSNYQDLCQISKVNRDRVATGDKRASTYTDRQLDLLEFATDGLSSAIDYLNTLVELPPGS